MANIKKNVNPSNGARVLVHFFFLRSIINSKMRGAKLQQSDEKSEKKKNAIYTDLKSIRGKGHLSEFSVLTRY